MDAVNPRLFPVLSQSSASASGAVSIGQCAATLATIVRARRVRCRDPPSLAWKRPAARRDGHLRHVAANRIGPTCCNLLVYTCRWSGTEDTSGRHALGLRERILLLQRLQHLVARHRRAEHEALDIFASHLAQLQRIALV